MLNHALRYEPAVAALRQVGTRRVLDVGSGSRGVASYLEPGWEITACDLSFDDYGSARTGDGAGVTRVEGSVLALPFEDRSFDAVLCLDVLEHLRAEDRPRALAELVRVTARRLVVGCPIGAPAARVDARTARVFGAIRRPPPPWLVEHAELTLPEPEELLAPLRGHGALTVLPNNNATAQLAVAALEALPLVRYAPLALSRRIERAIRADATPQRLVELLRGGDRGDVYRLIALLDV